MRRSLSLTVVTSCVFSSVCLGLYKRCQMDTSAQCHSILLWLWEGLMWSGTQGFNVNPATALLQWHKIFKQITALTFLVKWLKFEWSFCSETFQQRGKPSLNKLTSLIGGRRYWGASDFWYILECQKPVISLASLICEDRIRWEMGECQWLNVHVAHWDNRVGQV